MNTKTWAVLCCSLCASLPALAQEDERMYQPWVFRFDLGGNIPQDPKLKLYDGPVTGGDSLDLGAGIQMDLSAGYRLTRWLSVEAEMGISGNEVKAVGNWSYPDSYLSQLALMANLVIERPDGRLIPYAGIGAGGVFSSLSFGNSYYYYYSTSDGYGTDFAAAAQAFGGLRYRLTKQASLGVMYRFVVMDDQKWNIDWWNGADFTVSAGSTAIHSIALAYSYSF